MAEKLSVKLVVAGREYPMSIEPSQEQAYRAATAEINRLVRVFEENFKLKDRQDSLAMCAISFASQLLQKKIETTNIGAETLQRLEKINRLADDLLADS